MKLATWLGAAVAAGASAALVVLGPLAASAQPANDVASALIEEPSCNAVGADADAELSSTPAVPGAQAVSVIVPAVVLLKLDGAGRVAAVSTNTGCAPRAGDEVYTVQAAGSLVRIPVLPMVEWRGDFTAIGVFQAQQG